MNAGLPVSPPTQLKLSCSCLVLVGVGMHGELQATLLPFVAGTLKKKALTHSCYTERRAQRYSALFAGCRSLRSK